MIRAASFRPANACRPSAISQDPCASAGRWCARRWWRSRSAGSIEVRTGSGAFVREKPAEQADGQRGPKPERRPQRADDGRGRDRGARGRARPRRDLAAMAAEVDGMVADHDAGRRGARRTSASMSPAHASGNAALAMSSSAYGRSNTRPSSPSCRNGCASPKTGRRRSAATGDPRRDPQCEGGRPRGTPCARICIRCWR